MAIRYDKQLNNEINRVIKNFNQKIARLEKTERELLPSKITKKEIKQSFENRTDLRRKLKELQRFSNRGAEDIIVTQEGYRTTRYDLTNLIKERSRAKRSLTQEIKRLETTKPTIFGKETSATYSQMGSSRYLNVKKKRESLNKDIRKMNREEYERYKKLISKINIGYKQNAQFKQSYLDMLTDLGYFFDYDLNKIDELKEKINQLDDDNFTKLFNTEKSIKAITDYYPNILKTRSKQNFEDTKKDVHDLYNRLYENIDDILKDYKQ